MEKATFIAGDWWTSGAEFTISEISLPDQGAEGLVAVTMLPVEPLPKVWLNRSLSGRVWFKGKATSPFILIKNRLVTIFAPEFVL